MVESPFMGRRIRLTRNGQRDAGTMGVGLASVPGGMDREETNRSLLLVADTGTLMPLDVHLRDREIRGSEPSRVGVRTATSGTMGRRAVGAPA